MNRGWEAAFDGAWLAMQAHAEAEYPAESVGVIGLDGTYKPMSNLHVDPAGSWQIEDVVLAGVGAIVHSHPSGAAFPSGADMESQIAAGIPYGVVPCPEGKAVEPFFWPDGGRPYLGRPYRHGVTDCLQLVRDWLRRERGIEVPPFAYDWGEGDRLVAGAEELGWASIDPAAAVAGDVVLLGRGRPTHCGVLLEGGLLLHHPGAKPWDPTCLSRREPAARLSRLVVGVVRPA